MLIDFVWFGFADFFRHRSFSDFGGTLGKRWLLT
jgi:uncharacterized metal-binding protein